MSINTDLLERYWVLIAVAGTVVPLFWFWLCWMSGLGGNSRKRRR